MRIARRPGLVLVALVVVAMVAGCSSSSGGGGGLKVENAWARPSTGMDRAGAAYAVITNAGTQADALIGASSPAAKTVEIHETTPGASGMMAMQPVAKVEIPAGGSVELKPGSYHVMLIDLTGELKAGDKIDLTLRFEKGGSITVKAEVRAQ